MSAKPKMAILWKLVFIPTCIWKLSFFVWKWPFLTSKIKSVKSLYNKNLAIMHLVKWYVSLRKLLCHQFADMHLSLTLALHVIINMIHMIWVCLSTKKCAGDGELRLYGPSQKRGTSSMNFDLMNFDRLITVLRTPVWVSGWNNIKLQY